MIDGGLADVDYKGNVFLTLSAHSLRLALGYSPVCDCDQTLIIRGIWINRVNIPVVKGVVRKIRPCLPVQVIAMGVSEQDQEVIGILN